VAGSPYPWYDSWWLSLYARAREVLERSRPDVLPEFVEAFEVLKTPPDFEVREFDRVFDDEVLWEIRRALDTVEPEPRSYEVGRFGRSIVHDHPLITELQESIVDRVSEAAGEPVEPSYNFLSLYTEMGVCPVHLDAPNAKWTLDMCVRQSEPWPIHLSRAIAWPEPYRYDRDGWEDEIKGDHDFESYSLEPGQAILFSGSGQWHYRDPHPGGDGSQFCDLVFFHFLPKGMREKVDPDNWAGIFGVPELAPPPQKKPRLLRRVYRRLKSPAALSR
jgi:hypothetical protein